MTQKFEYKGREYWVTVDPTTHPETNENVFVAFVKNQEPGVIFGEAIKDENGHPLFFGDTIAAFTNANAIVQSEIDSRP